MNILSIISLSTIMLFACNQQTKETVEVKVQPKSKIEKVVLPPIVSDTVFTFENYKTNELPKNWSQYATGRKKETKWEVINNKGTNVLAQLSSENPNYHFNVIVFNKIKAKNVELTVRMKGVEGSMDRGGGFVWRFTDADNYYVVRANPLEDNVVLYKVVNGGRTDLPLVGQGKTYGMDDVTLGGGWNTLKLRVIDDLFIVYLNGKELFRVKDKTFENSGKIGLWTKADAVTYFDDFEVKEIGG